MGSQKKINAETIDPMRPEFKGLSQDLGSYARTLVGRDATPYAGSFTAGMSTGEQNLLDAINNNVGSGGAFAPQRNALISDILGGKRLSPNTNPYLQDMIGALTTESNRGLGSNLNILDAAFGKGGMGSGSGRSAAAIETTRQAHGDLTNSIANILGQNYQQGLNEQMTTLGSILPTMDQYNSNNLYAALSANALPRTIQQNDLTAQYQEFLRQLQEPMQYTQLASQILGAAPQYQVYQPQEASMPWWQQALLGGVQGAAQGAAVAMML